MSTRRFEDKKFCLQFTALLEYYSDPGTQPQGKQQQASFEVANNTNNVI